MREITKKILQNYYQNYFDTQPLIELIGLTTFNRREFAFDLGNNIFTRNLSFKTPTLLKEYMSTHGVFQAYVGAVYTESLSAAKTAPTVKLDAKELVFDIDLDAYDPVRKCGCTGETFCVECWSLAQDAMLFLNDTLREDFGFQDIRWFFSGRRGVHGWVRDYSAKKLNKEQRVSIVRYVSLVNEIETGSHVDKLLKYAKPLNERICTIIAHSYFQKTSISELLMLGYKKNDAEKVIEYSKNTKKFEYNRVIPRYVDKEKIAQTSIVNRYPRIDRKVTVDLRRVLRIPNSIHGKTGNLCVPIKDITGFDPFDVPSIFHYIS